MDPRTKAERRRRRLDRLGVTLRVSIFFVCLLWVRKNYEFFDSLDRERPAQEPVASKATNTHRAEPRLAKTRKPLDTNQIFSNMASATNTTKRPLPCFERGGFIFFLHIPKTGGSTIRVHLSNETKVPTLSYAFVSGAGGYNQTRSYVWQYVNTGTRRRRKTLFLEIHGRDSPHLMDLAQQIRRWKQAADKHGVATFFFTILREPTAYALSYFNFFHVQRPNPHFDQVTPTEEHLMEYSNENPQCQFLVRGEYALRRSTKHTPPTLAECEQAYRSLLGTMDWVGTTENMNDETLVLLKRMLHQRKGDFAPERVSSKSPNASIAISQVSPLGLKRLEGISRFDVAMHQRVRRDFPFSMWDLQS